uniref:Snurportin-1 n=1 Tax=Arion vulgaris TaxID=1028688 RepID=A0A0B7AYD0_9EUPU
MEELTTFVEGFAITNEPNRTSAPHPRYSQYKEKTARNDQNARRQQLLEIQKNRRFDFMNHVRKLTDNDWVGEEDKDEEDEKPDQSMEVEVMLSRPGRNYKNQLMLSEWLVEVPKDFEAEWLAVLCPMAKRCLVVASRGKTRAFSKSGFCINSFPSHLPGGCRRSSERNTTILDCLYSEVNQTYYILDLMCWNGCTVYDGETEFRFYWLHEKLKEYSSLGETSTTNPCKFIGLPSFSCTQDAISNAITSAPFKLMDFCFTTKVLAIYLAHLPWLSG